MTPILNERGQVVAHERTTYEEYQKRIARQDAFRRRRQMGALLFVVLALPVCYVIAAPFLALLVNMP